MTDTLNKAVYMDERGVPVFLGRAHPEPPRQRGRRTTFDGEKQITLRLSDYHCTFDKEGNLTGTQTVLTFKVVEIKPHLWIYEPVDRETELVMGLFRDDPERIHIKHLMDQLK